MSASEFHFACLLDPRLSAYATSPLPAWLWSTDGERILWANPAGAALFGADSPAALAALTFEADHPARVQIVRLAETLPGRGAPRLEPLRNLGTTAQPKASAVTCACMRIAISDGQAILVAATEQVGPVFSLEERARRLLAGCDDPVAAFTSDGTLLHATRAVHDAIGGAENLTALGGEALRVEANRSGKAEGKIVAGTLSLARIGSGSDAVLLATLDATRVVQEQTPPAAPVEPAPKSEETVVAAAQPSPVFPGATPNSHLPLRFVWQSDADDVFTVTSDEFTRLIGPRTAGAFGRPWQEIEAELKLDAGGEVARALASRETWSGITVPWPVDGSDARLPVSLSGLPVFDRDRTFQGYRGFGICRDVERLEALATARELAPPDIFADVKSPDTAPAIEEPAAPDVPQADTGETEAPESAKVLPFRPVPPPPPPEKPPELNPVERSAFRELARRLSDRLNNGEATAEQPIDDSDFAVTAPVPQPPPPANVAAVATASERSILDRLPVGVLVYRLNDLLYANRAFLKWTGYETLHDLAQAGGLDTLFIDMLDTAPGQNSNGDGKRLAITTQNGQQMPIEGRLFTTAWNGDNALTLMLDTNARVPSPVADATPPKPDTQTPARLAELESMLDTATDGVLTIDRKGRVLTANRSAQALFGYDESDLTSLLFADLFASESREVALDYLDRLGENGDAVLMNQGREVIGRVRQGGFIPLFMTLGVLGDSGEKFCVVFRDVTFWKKNEEDLIAAKRQAEKATASKSEFLAKLSHEIRTPLNSIIGFSEVMIEERFGPVGNERYLAYLRDIHSSGGNLIALLNELLELSKIETGSLDLSFDKVSLNDLVQQCVAVMQPQANRERIIIRTALHASLPQIVADARSVRQVVLNVLSNSIKFTGTGGQVIVSTAITDNHEAVLRVRDTGTGMSEGELAGALEPFRQLSTTARWGTSGTGLGLPITKALVEANHARFRITSEVDSGTLVEIAFPESRVSAE